MGRNAKGEYHQYLQIADVMLAVGKDACAAGLSPEQVLVKIKEHNPGLFKTICWGQAGRQSHPEKSVYMALQNYCQLNDQKNSFSERPFFRLSPSGTPPLFTLKPKVWARHRRKQTMESVFAKAGATPASHPLNSKWKSDSALLSPQAEGPDRRKALATYTLEQLQTDGLRFAMAYLLPQVRWQVPITYGEVARRLASDLDIKGRIFSTQIGGVYGALMDRLHKIDPAIPLINVLVVRDGKAGLPSSGVDGYLWERFGPKRSRIGPVAPERRRAMVLKATEEVYAYQHWDRDYQRLFGKPVPAAAKSALPVGTEQDGKTRKGGGFGGEPESAEHKALKAYVLAHPSLVGFGTKPLVRKAEFLLLSCDKVDVMFQSQTHTYLVEVKSSRSNEADLARGIYQCIKYRAVYLAQCADLAPYMTVISVLVIERAMPNRLQALAKKNGIRTIVKDG